MKGGAGSSAWGFGFGGGAHPSANPDWTIQLEARQRTINNIMTTLRMYAPVPIPEKSLQTFALQLEEEIFNASTSWFDYLFKYFQKMMDICPQTNSIPNQQAGKH
ncbi:Mediator of RNA polymerase II transcription subunit 15a [Rhynchospora pubera]|uniref:Mediator of RNA polymerase II transcription subunit 15a n=1 Tax=Rhynchospora pubera TaxID=906938 RepID=A0AAV8C490_9POAL|nr:Mediator of RNA polymerase II transcription subunit 15a [Rhynchospora pubera]